MLFKDDIAFRSWEKSKHSVLGDASACIDLESIVRLERSNMQFGDKSCSFIDIIAFDESAVRILDSESGNANASALFKFLTSIVKANTSRLQKFSEIKSTRGKASGTFGAREVAQRLTSLKYGIADSRSLNNMEDGDKTARAGFFLSPLASFLARILPSAKNHAHDTLSASHLSNAVASSGSTTPCGYIDIEVLDRQRWVASDVAQWDPMYGTLWSDSRNLMAFLAFDDKEQYTAWRINTSLDGPRHLLDLSSVVSVKEIDIDGTKCLEIITFDGKRVRIRSAQEEEGDTLQGIKAAITAHLQTRMVGAGSSSFSSSCLVESNVVVISQNSGDGRVIPGRSAHFSLWEGSLLVVFDTRDMFIDWVSGGADISRVHEASGFLFARNVSGLHTASMDSESGKCYSLRLHDGSEVRFCLDKDEKETDLDILHAKWISFLGEDVQAGGFYTHYFKTLMRSEEGETSHFIPSENAKSIGLQQSSRPLSMPVFSAKVPLSSRSDLAISLPNDDDFASSIPSSALPMQALQSLHTSADFQRTTAFIRDSSSGSSKNVQKKVLRLAKPLDFPIWDEAKPPAIPPPAAPFSPSAPLDAPPVLPITPDDSKGKRQGGKTAY